MKALRNIAMLLLLSAGFAFGQNETRPPQPDPTITGDKKVNIDFSKYKTFGWVDTHKPNGRIIEYTTYRLDPDPSTERASQRPTPGDRRNYKQEIVYSYSVIIPSSDTAVNHTLMNSVVSEMQGRGYKQAAANPDLLIAYKVFDQHTSMKGFDAPPTEINGGTEVRQPSDTLTYELKPGTISISLIDAKTSEVVWEGFASGVAGTNDIINDPVKIQQAVNLIFQKYQWRGDKFSKE